ncbi:hypothetical protein BU14_0154s0012 [Porphyra umbilicalis]|uniref:Uncharacterized protein n=1 Tax=Porphyra umbilicalis TaxID=2786 RepID=A0A1X6P922_PORUM|nr:hypothetical protein BU14_0154s0012 [Porphyra umbilicalis]|eukprot:OSX77236.1 hypothetical protein BU14_0154s0012 [Porphyra umbilicalis]
MAVPTDILTLLPPNPGPFTYDSTLLRLVTLRDHPERRLWSPLDVHFLVTAAAGDLDLDSLSENQSTALLTTISRIWPATARKTRGQSFRDALKTYLTGDDAADAEDAARALAAVARPAPPPAPALPAPVAPHPPPAAPAARSPSVRPFLLARPLPSLPGLIHEASCAAPPAASASAGTAPPQFVSDANASLDARDLPFGALFPQAAASDVSAGAAALPLTPAHNIHVVDRYYTYDARKYHGADTESLYRHVAAFRSLCTRMGVHPSDRAACIPSSLGASRHNLPSLCHDNPDKTETELWTLIQKRVSTPARMSRLRTTWQSTNILSFPRVPDETDVCHFGRLVEFLNQIQEQLGPLYQHRLSLRDRVLDAISTEPYWADLVARNLPDADALIDVVELLLEARTARGAAPMPPPAPSLAPLLPPTPIHSADLGPLTDVPTLTDAATGDTCSIEIGAHPADPAAIYWTMRQFRPGDAKPYAPSTAIVDTGSPPEVFGECWRHRHRPSITSPLQPTATRVRVGRDMPSMLGAVGLMLCVPDTRGRTHTLPLPSVLVVASDTIPLIVGLQKCATHGLLVDCEALTVSVKGTDISFACAVSHGHLCLPSPALAINTYYTAPQLIKIHRQFGHTGTAKVVAAFPKGTFSAQDVATMGRVVRSCGACQLHAHLPRRPKYGLPTRPAYVNRVVLIAVFSVDPALPKVLDITCMDTDFGAGTFLPTMHFELIVGVLYLSWFSRYGLCETVIADRGSNLHAPAVTHALQSMGNHLRVAPTEAP